MLVLLDPIAFRVWPAGRVFETTSLLWLKQLLLKQVFVKFLSNMNFKAILLVVKYGTD